jgi:hypothetical protein
MLMRHDPKIDTPEFRQGVSDSFNIYQATIAMVSLFVGFVFVSLLQMITGSDPLDKWRVSIIWLLIVAMISLTIALLCFHATAHRVVRFWRIFYPVSVYNLVGAIAFNIGLLTMYLSIAALLASRQMYAAAITVAASGVGLISLGYVFRSMHGNAFYMVHVDEPPAKNI